MHQLKRRQPGTWMCIIGVGSGREACKGPLMLLPCLGSLLCIGWVAVSLHIHKGLLGHERALARYATLPRWRAGDHACINSNLTLQ